MSSPMDTRRYAATVLLLLSLFCKSFSHSIIQTYAASDATSDDGRSAAAYCDSWRFAVEVNDAGAWTQHPARCQAYVEEYMTGDRYWLDSEVVADYSIEYAKTVAVAGDGSDAWVFDMDETVLSTLSYQAAHGFGSEFDPESFYKWVDLANAPAIPATLKLYNELLNLGFSIFILTGRFETQRNVTETNLLQAGYTNWKGLLLKVPSDSGKPTIVYKSERRKEIEDQGHVIHGNSGDQWSDLIGFSVATRSFKLPNPMYYLP